MSGLKILQVSNRVPYPLNEGGTIGIYNYTRGFSELGCEVTLFAQAARKHRIDMEEAKRVLGGYGRFEVFPVNTDVNAWDAFKNLFSDKSYNVERFYDPMYEQALIKELQQNEYDVIQIEGTFPALYSDVIFKHSKNAKVVLRQHNVEFQIWERLAKNAKNPIKKWYLSLLSKRLKRFERKHLNQYAALVPVTEDDGNLFKEMGCTIPIFPSPAGIDTEMWKPSENISPKTLYHIGSLEWMPNLEAMLWFVEEVWPEILKQDPEVQFYVAGKGMPEHIKNMDVTNVHMIGEVDSATDFVQDKSISVVPLKSGSGIRLKILEAMSAGKPVVSTTIGAQGIEYEPNTNIVIGDSATEFAHAVMRLLNDEAFDQKVRQEGRKLIEERYSNRSVVQRLIDFYQTL
jgi:glycosyltransferase involved in cell wall biosynthesis